MLASGPLHAADSHPLQPSPPRTVVVSEMAPPPQIRAGLLQSTLIVLPAEEKVASVFAGDTVAWIFDGGHVASRFISVNLNPFIQPRIVLCSFQFARTKDAYVRQTPWDLVVIDEAHRLRNVYKSSNKIANAIKAAIADRPKTLLTATPLQNSLLELYGLVSFVDEYTFGDLRSFRSQFSRMTSQDEYRALRERIRPICQRTLRRQVLPYISYTNRHALVQEFIPTDAEQQLYTLVSDYLQSPRLYALPASQRQLMTLILRKLLASSTYAISDTLLGLANKLEAVEKAQAALDAPAPESLGDNFESLPEIEDEWLEDEPDEDASQAGTAQQLSPEQRQELRAEKAKLREFHELAKSIQKNSKGEVLLSALQKGFEAARQNDHSLRREAAQGGSRRQCNRIASLVCNWHGSSSAAHQTRPAIRCGTSGESA